MAKKKLIITNRELVRNWARLKAKLHYGETDQLVLRDNGNTYIITQMQKERKPGDCGWLLEKLKKTGPNDRVRKVNIKYNFKSLPGAFENE